MKIVLILLSSMFLSGCSAAYGPFTEEGVEFKVNKTERVCSGGTSKSCKYLIFTSKETFQNSDSLYGFKFNSSDL